MLRFNSISEGDLLFWSTIPEEETETAKKREFDSAVSAAGGKISAPFHVALVTRVNIEPYSIIIVHAVEKGVLCENLEEYNTRLLEDYTKLKLSHCKIENEEIDNSILQKSVGFVLSKIGCQYNDVFSEDCRNSKGLEAYYCCQLIRKSYEWALGGKKLFELQPLNFRNSDGNLIQYWVDYFVKKGRPLPEDQYGSNPTSLMKSDHIRIIEEIVIERK